MIVRINKTEEILSRLEKRELSWSKEDQEKYFDSMEKLHRECVMKQIMSEIKSADCYLD